MFLIVKMHLNDIHSVSVQNSVNYPNVKEMSTAPEKAPQFSQNLCKFIVAGVEMKE